MEWLFYQKKIGDQMEREKFLKLIKTVSGLEVRTPHGSGYVWHFDPVIEKVGVKMHQGSRYVVADGPMSMEFESDGSHVVYFSLREILQANGCEVD